ncbi:GntR family transcriptional regulator [Marinilabiliaceae bacterium JC017]|nr:GntR family transcriptional regulator [Marinilabiliaceae bacterium JC017]
MVQIGRYNTLRVVKEVDFGLYLDVGEQGEILLPIRYVPEGCKPEDEIEVFIYLDSEDRIIATTEKPYAQIGDFVFLEVKSVNNFGAFLDWGLMKDILVPFREQKMKMQEGKKYLVHVLLDHESERIVASAKIDKYLDNLMPDYELEQEVDLLIAAETDLGYKAIINNLHWGMLYKNEVYKTIYPGQRMKGYIKKIRSDEKIDLALQPAGYEKVGDLSTQVLALLKEKNGFLAVNDKSPAELIYRMFGVSKKNFKKAVGALYKQRLITIDEEGIRLV